ncbi:hypothetical protein KC19_VG085900 [Ceratodon purpureus]|uniref:Secreted protein n=1 Tax=Ceratodon purpureus TaxID=3225 RepID=A0A8T0HNV2_CERPU|nr:hypothetical protein KC19_VG085900 [Ceratodon purpureus]
MLEFICCVVLLMCTPTPVATKFRSTLTLRTATENLKRTDCCQVCSERGIKEARSVSSSRRQSFFQLQCRKGRCGRTRCRGSTKGRPPFLGVLTQPCLCKQWYRSLRRVLSVASVTAGDGVCSAAWEDGSDSSKRPMFLEASLGFGLASCRRAATATARHATATQTAGSPD